MSTENVAESGASSRPGRKRDASRDAAILDATLDVLAERGFDGTTLDIVAARAHAGKSTVYRRWSSKTELVLEALSRLDTDEVDPAALPDTGSLRGDLLALLGPWSPEQEARRIGIVADLAALSKREPQLAERAVEAIVAPFVEVNRLLITRAIERGEYPPADVDVLARVVPELITYQQAVRNRPISDDDLIALLDTVLLAALRGAPPIG